MELSALLEECHCDCHKNKDVMHVMPCCQPCRSCGRNIKASQISSHEVHCTIKTKKKPPVIFQASPASK